MPPGQKAKTGNRSNIGANAIKDFENGLHKKIFLENSTNNKCCRVCGEMGTLLHCWWECKSAQPLWRTIWKFFKKLKTELPHDTAIPPLGMKLEKMKSLIQQDTCTPMFVAVLFIIAKTWKQTKFSSTNEWIKKRSQSHTHWVTLLYAWNTVSQLYLKKKKKITDIWIPTA